MISEIYSDAATLRNDGDKRSYKKRLRKNHHHKGKGGAYGAINPLEKGALPPGIALFEGKVVKYTAWEINDSEDVPEKKDLIGHCANE
jgi:hypothetical protein